MKTIWLLALIGGALSWGSCSERNAPTSTPAAAALAQQPNVLLITMDTTRADALGAYGQPVPTSPNIDQLAARGVIFEQATTTNPETLPSHSALFTGKWPFVHGVRSNTGYLLGESQLTIAEILRNRGYQTGAEVAATVLRRETRISQGFDHYHGAESPGVKLKVVKYSRGEMRERTAQIRVGADITRKAIDFLRRHSNQPFFLWLHYFDPHSPYSPPPAFARKIPDSPYLAEVASADFQIGLVLRELEALGVSDRTLVVLTADHGEGLDEHGEPSHSYFLYDTTMRVPLVMAGLPDLPAGKRIASHVRIIDVAPTILELLGLPPLEGAQGVSLTPLIEGKETDLRLPGYGEATRFTATFGLPVLRFLREGRWKYIHKVSPELYDVIADPQELENLAGRHPEIVEKLRSELIELLKNAPPAPADAAAAVDTETAERLMALGYITKSPAFAIGGEVASLALEGDDPNEKRADVQAVSKVSGLLDREGFADAMVELEELRRRNPDSTFIKELSAEALVGLGRYDEGIDLLGEVMAAEPGNRQVAYSFANALMKQGRTSEALGFYESLRQEEPCDERVMIDLHRVLRKLGQHEALVGMLATGAEQCPDRVRNLNNYAWALATLPEPHLRDGEKAIRVMRDVIKGAASPNSAYLDTLAAALAEAGDFQGALRTASQAVEALRAARGAPETIAQLEGHLDHFRSRRAIREPSSPQTR